MNQALEALYIDEEVNGDIRMTHQLKEPFDTLHTAQNGSHNPAGVAPKPPQPAQNARSALPKPGRALLCNQQGPPW
jgi:hypothetical protein